MSDSIPEIYFATGLARQYAKNAKKVWLFPCLTSFLFFAVFLGPLKPLWAEDFTGPETFTFLIGRDQINGVWTYLRDRYGGKNFFLTRIDPALRTEFFAELWYEEYFDTPDLALLREGNSARYSAWIDNSAKKPGIKNEMAEISVRDFKRYGVDPAWAGAFATILGKSIRFEVAHYRVTTSPDEKHRLFGIVKRAVRPVFKEVIRKLGIERPLCLVNVLNVESRRAGFRIMARDIPVGRIYLEEATAEKFGVGSIYGVLRFVSDPGSPGNRPIEEAVKADLLRCVSALKSVRETEYQLAFRQLGSRFPLLNLLLRYPLIKKCGEVVIMALFGLVVLALFFHKRLFKGKNL